MKSRIAGVLLAGLAWTASVQAGGHFDVDDAGTLGPGECQSEIWGGHGTPGGIDYFHLGPACRVGAVEWGLDLDLLRVAPERAALLGPQLKWNFYGQQADAPLALALVLSTVYDLRNDGRWGGQLVLPLTWQALESLAVNINLGVDWAPVDGARTPRSGVGLDWALLPQVALLAEHSRGFDRSTTRVGVRWSITPTTSLDASVARVHGEGVRLFTLGLNQSFSRP